MDSTNHNGVESEGDGDTEFPDDDEIVLSAEPIDEVNQQPEQETETDFHDMTTLRPNYRNRKNRKSGVIHSESEDETEQLSEHREVTMDSNVGSQNHGSDVNEMDVLDQSVSSYTESGGDMTTVDSEGSDIDLSSTGDSDIQVEDTADYPKVDARESLKMLLAAVSKPKIDHFKGLSSPDKRRKRKGTTAGRKSKTTKKRKKATSHNRSKNDEDEESMDSSNVHDTSLEDKEAGYIGDSQEVSIHRIQLTKFESSLREEDIIQKIILEYNKPDHGQLNNRPNRHKFIEQEVTNVPEVKEADKQFFQGEDFSLKIYVQNVSKKVGLLGAFGIRLDANVLHTIIFYYRKGDLFALTTGQAWNCVQWCSDYDFPAQIAARLLSEQGQLDTTSKGIIGNEVSSRRTMKSHQERNPFLLELCTSFSAKLRPKSSLQVFRAFKSHHSDVKVVVALASIRFKKRLDASDFPSILDRCSVIARREPTWIFSYLPTSTASSSITATTPHEDERDSDAHLNNLTRVSHDMSKSLDIQLGTLIRERLNGSRVEQLDNFRICHKHYDDFANASKIALYYKGRNIKEYFSEPTLSQVLDDLGYANLRNSVNSRLEKRSKTDGRTFESEFIEELDKVKINYRVAGTRECDEKKAEKLFNYLEGCFWNKNDERVYWHVLSQWCSVRDGYLLIVHQQFLKMLKKCVMSVSQDGYLSIPWSAEPETHPPLESGIKAEDASVFNYVRLYENTENFYPFPLGGIGEQKEADETHFCDLMYINEEKKEVSLYYITRRLSTRVKITKSTLSIQNTFQGKSTTAGKEIKKDIQKLFDKNSSIRATFDKVEDFASAIAKARIVYAFGKEGVRLEDERRLSTKISLGDIEKALESASRDPRLASSVLDALKAANYFDRSGSITSKLLISKYSTFDVGVSVFESKEQTNDFIFNSIVQNFKSKYDGILMKLEFLKIKKDLDEMNLKFFLCPIPELQV